MPVVRDNSKVDRMQSQFEAIGYEYMGRVRYSGSEISAQRR